MANKCVEHNQCTDCGEVFTTKGSLSKHTAKKVCFRSLFPSPMIRDHIPISNAIVSAIESPRLRFHASQRLGVFSPKLYPMLFCKHLPASMQKLEHLLPLQDESIRILVNILRDEPSNYLVLPTKSKLIIDNQIYDLSDFTLPPSEEFDELPIKLMLS